MKKYKYRIDMFDLNNQKIGQKIISSRSEVEAVVFVHSKDFKHKRKSDMRGYNLTRVK